jgi:hypothetical protein
VAELSKNLSPSAFLNCRNSALGQRLPPPLPEVSVRYAALKA